MPDVSEGLKQQAPVSQGEGQRQGREVRRDKRLVMVRDGASSRGDQRTCWEGEQG